MQFIHQTIENKSQLTYLFELIDGMCESSFANLVATHVGIPTNLIERSKEVSEDRLILIANSIMECVIIVTSTLTFDKG
jgi:DNA mismatch repair ATPase MutS